MGFPQFRQHAEAIERRQVEVEHNQIGWLCQRCLQSFHAVVHGLRHMSIAGQRRAYVPGEFAFVFDNQNAHVTLK